MTIEHEVVSCTMCEKEFWVDKNIAQGLRTAVDEHLCLQCGKVVGGLKWNLKNYYQWLMLLIWQLLL